MTDLPKLICWLDLETTGSDGEGDAILEVGMIMTDNDLKELGSFEKVYRLDPFMGLGMPTKVYQMHDKSGLVAEALSAPYHATNYQAEFSILEWIKQFTGRSTQHIALAGSGVSHFDRKFIRRDWPNVDKRFTYWAYDVGVMRRMFELAGVEIPTRNEDKPHRALADARIHLEDGRRYLGLLRQLVDKDMHWDRFFTTAHVGHQADCKICNSWGS